MKKNKHVVLVICAPEETLEARYPTIVLKPYIGEIPLGVLYIASELENHDFRVSVIDNTIKKYSEDDLLNRIISIDPLLVGFSVSVLNLEKVKSLSIKLKKERADLPIVYGGPNVTILPQQHAAFDFVDYVVTGQGEIALKEICEVVYNGYQSKSQAIKQKIIKGKAIESLDALAYPARHLIDINDYSRRALSMDSYPTDYVCSSRGCPFKCTFCSSKIVWQRNYTYRSPESIVDEMEFLATTYGSKGIYFREDNFTVNEARVADICREIIDRKLSIQWECESRVDTLTPKALELMKNAGCSGIWCGVESGSQKILNYVRKGYDVKQVREFYQWCHEFDINTSACFMLGFPIEDADDIKRSFELCISLKTDYAHFATFIGFPGSELYRTVLEESLWEESWGDILIPRSHYFSFNELCLLEKTINTNLMLPKQHHLVYDLLKELSS